MTEKEKSLSSRKNRSFYSYDKYALKPGRKALHVSSAWIGFVYMYSSISHELFIVCASAATVLLVLFDFVRARSKTAGDFIHRRLHFLFIERDYKRLNSASWYLIAVVLVTLVFGGDSPEQRLLIFLVILYLAFGDTAASVFGKLYGRHKMPFVQGTRVGFIAGFLANIGVGLAYMLLDNTVPLPLQAAALGALGASVGEAIPSRFLDDNVTLTMGGALCLAIFLVF